MPRPVRGETSGNAADVRVTRRPARARMVDYRIPISECPPELLDEFARFRRFPHDAGRHSGAAAPPVKEVTAKKYEDQIRGLLGWMRLTIPREHPTESLTSMRVAFPTKTKRGAALAFEHLQWLSDERDAAPSTRWWRFARSSPPRSFCGETRTRRTTRNDRKNVPIVRQLRKINKDAGRRPRNAGPRTSAKMAILISTSTSCGAWKTSARRGCTTAGRGATAPWRGVCSDFSSSVCCRACRTGGAPSREPEIGRTLFKRNPRKTPATGKTRAPREVNDDSSDEGLEIVNAERTGWIASEDIRDGGGVRVSVGDASRAGRLQDGEGLRS